MIHQYQIPYSVQEKFEDNVLNKLRKDFITMIERENIHATSYKILSSSSVNITHYQKTELIQLLLNMTADGINLLHQSYNLAFEAGVSNEFSPILDFLTGYYFEVDDIRNDNMGPLGWIDDSYLCFQGLQQINQIYSSIYNKNLIDIDFNPYISFMKQLLDQNELYELDRISLEKFASIDWKNILLRLVGVSFVNVIFGNHGRQQSYNDNSSGKSWERDMFENASKLGISLDFRY